jgi:hypothetical protein
MRDPLAVATRMSKLDSHPGCNSLLLSTTKVSLLVLPFMLATPSAVYGYVDPGTGSFLYQAAYVAFLGAAFYVRKMLNRFCGKRNKTRSGSNAK